MKCKQGIARVPSKISRSKKLSALRSAKLLSYQRSGPLGLLLSSSGTTAQLSFDFPCFLLCILISLLLIYVRCMFIFLISQLYTIMMYFSGNIHVIFYFLFKLSPKTSNFDSFLNYTAYRGLPCTPSVMFITQNHH